MALTRDQLTDTIADAIHQNCGVDSREECGAWDMHVDDAINVIAELQGIGLIMITGIDGDAEVETP